MRIFIGESDRWEGKSLCEALVREAKAQGLAGATVVHGNMGYGAHSRLHTARLVDISPDLPVIVEFIDEEAKVQAFLPTVEAMVHEGMVTLERVSVLFYRHRDTAMATAEREMEAIQLRCELHRAADSTRALLQTTLPGLWAELEDIRPEKLTGYGVVDQEIRAALGPPIDRLITLVHSMQEALDGEQPRTFAEPKER